MSQRHTQPNTRLDQDGVQLEKLEQVNRSRGGLLGHFTKQCKEFDELLLDNTKYKEVTGLKESIDQTYSRVVIASSQYMALLHESGANEARQTDAVTKQADLERKKHEYDQRYANYLSNLRQPPFSANDVDLFENAANPFDPIALTIPQPRQSATRHGSTRSTSSSGSAKIRARLFKLKANSAAQEAELEKRTQEVKRKAAEAQRQAANAAAEAQRQAANAAAEASEAASAAREIEIQKRALEARRQADEANVFAEALEHGEIDSSTASVFGNDLLTDPVDETVPNLPYPDQAQPSNQLASATSPPVSQALHAAPAPANYHLPLPTGFPAPQAPPYQQPPFPPAQVDTRRLLHAPGSLQAFRNDDSPNPNPIPNPLMNPPEGNSNVEYQTGEDRFVRAMTAMATSLQQGFALPKRDMHTYDGDPIDFHEFMTAFDTYIDKKVTDPETKLGYLIYLTTGKAHDAIRQCGIIKPAWSGYYEARKILREEFGQKYQVVEAYLKKLTEGPTLRPGDTTSLNALARLMRNCSITLKQWGYSSSMDNQDNIGKIFLRLPKHMQGEFLRQAEHLYEREKEPSFSNLADYVIKKANVAKSHLGHLMAKGPESKRPPKPSFNRRQPPAISTFSTQQTLVNTNSNDKTPDCYACDGRHLLCKCEVFKGKSVQARLDLIRDKRLCFNCFGNNHFVTECKNKGVCRVRGCGKKHNSLLHLPRSENSSPVPSVSVNHVEGPSNAIGTGAEYHQVHVGASKTSVSMDQARKVLPKVVPVRVYRTDKSRYVDTYAFLDEGSTTTFCTNEIMDSLDMQNEATERNYSISTVVGKTECTGKAVSLIINGLPVEKYRDIHITNVLTIPKLPNLVNSIPSNDMLSGYDHLKDLDFPRLSTSEIGILIGADVQLAHDTIEIRRGTQWQPRAVLTNLGWSLCGIMDDGIVCDDTEVNFINVDNNTLSKQLLQVYEHDFNDSNDHQATGWSVQDKRAQEVFETSVKHVNGHYQMRLPWRSENMKLPFNRPMAEKRLSCLKRKFLKEPQLLKLYSDKIQEYVNDGYCRLVPPDCLHPGKRMWYIPHHATGGKFRVVFDVLRVGGRLQRSNYPTNFKHQIILPSKHPVTELIIQEIHIQEGHSGPLHVLAACRENYWIIKGHSTVKGVLRKCLHCSKQNAKIGQQIMAPLPVHRVTPGNPAFSYVGVDYMGPFYVKQGRSVVKRYGCVFTCLAIRAIHVEIATSLDVSSFLNAFMRFMNRRGRPKIVYSDNGTNFTAAEKNLRECITKWNSNQIHKSLYQQNIEWKFNPPRGSHQGGVWERMIRSIRKILRSLVGEQLLSDDSLSTLMTEVERILNGRPLTPLSSDPNDENPLTPNALLTGQLASNLPADEFVKADGYRKSWRQVQWLADNFWKRWTREYVPMLQPRQKWCDVVANFKIGDMVLLMDENTKRGVWPMGVVEKLFPDQNGVLRRVQVRTTTNTYLRDIRKLCYLEAHNNHDLNAIYSKLH